MKQRVFKNANFGKIIKGEKMLPIILLIIIFTASFRTCLHETRMSDRVAMFITLFFCLSILGTAIFITIGGSVFSGTNNQEMITTEESIMSFIDNKNNPVYLKYSFKWNGGSIYRYVEKNGKYPEYKEIPVREDVNIVEGNYEPVLVTHSYKANKNCNLLFGPTANWFIHDTWYEFYIPNGTFITY